MDFINQAMLFLLKSVNQVLGNYGLTIVVITVAIRLVLWPLNTAQTRSMKKMQELQPKLKEIQERFKDNPQKMQEAIMKFYSEHRFNPFAGCLPMLIQLPILFGLYGALYSPEFLKLAGNESFLFIKKLYATVHDSGGRPLDGIFTVDYNADYDPHQFVPLRLAKVSFNNGTTSEFSIPNPNDKVLLIRPPGEDALLGDKKIRFVPGQPLRMWLDLGKLGISRDYLRQIKSLDVDVQNRSTRELEEVVFRPEGNDLVSGIPTQQMKHGYNLDVLVLIIIYAILTLIYSKVMQQGRPKSATPTDATQARLMQLMPLMFVVVMFFFPIQAGVLLYLDVTMILMFTQTLWVNWSEDRLNASKNTALKPASQVVDVKAEK